MEGRQAMSRTQSKTVNGGKIAPDFPAAERKAIASKGGKKSVEVKRKSKAAKDILHDLFISDSTDKDLSQLAISKGIEGTELATLLIKMLRKAGNSAQMAELVFKLSGDLEQAPQQNITIVNNLSDEQLMAERAKILGSNSMINITPDPPKIE
jgi:hypothetical protein